LKAVNVLDIANRQINRVVLALKIENIGIKRFYSINI
jgi:hypothetical protein